MLVSVEDDEKVFASDLSIWEAVDLAKKLAHKKGNSQYNVICGKELCFWSGGKLCFYFVSEEGFAHLHKDKKFKKALKEALGSHLKSIRKNR